MHRTLAYTIFFIVLVLLQAFLFDNLNLSIYIYPLVYTAFIILLPIQTPRIAVLLLGFAIGVAVDAVSGTAGLHTIASLASAFCRPMMLRLSIGKEEANEGGIPNSVKLGNSSSETHSKTESYDDRSESLDFDSAGKKESAKPKSN